MTSKGLIGTRRIGPITELAYRGNPNKPAILFDEIKDYPKGYRVLVNMVHSVKRVALTLGMPLDVTPREFIPRWEEKGKTDQTHSSPGS